MKAYQIDDFGGPEVFRQSEVERPTAGPGEVLVRVVATSVNPVDCKLRGGSDRFDLTPPAVLGYDVSGIVEAVGAGVERFEAGDAVFYTPTLDARGAYAEYHACHAVEPASGSAAASSWERLAGLCATIEACSAWYSA